MDNLPPIGEFIDLDERRAMERKKAKQLSDKITVAAYATSTGEYLTLTIRIGCDLGAEHGLKVGDRFACLVHPDQRHIGLRPTSDGSGSALFTPKQSTALVYQTTVKADTLEAQPATEAKLAVEDGIFVISLDTTVT